MAMDNMEMHENEARMNALRQLISLTKDEFAMASYATMAGLDPDTLPETRKGWLAELRKLEGHAPTLEEVKTEAIIETRIMLSKTLENPIPFKGKLYSVTLEKQNLLAAQLGLFGLNEQAGIPTELSWNATGEACVPWTFEDLLTLSNTIATYVKPLAQHQRDAELAILGSKTEDKVRSAVTKYVAALAAVANV